MPDQIPPPGPERDAEIAKLLGWTAVDGADRDAGWRSPDGELHAWPPRYSTDPSACERLIADLAARNWVVVDIDAPLPTVHCVRGGDEAPVEVHPKTAATRPAAVSAAALSALRGGA